MLHLELNAVPCAVTVQNSTFGQGWEVLLPGGGGDGGG